MKGSTLLSLCFSWFLIFIFSTATDFIGTNQTLKNGETIFSAGGNFELGFFSPRNSNKRYLGIWYKRSTKTIVWVANRETPLNDPFGALKVTDTGNLVLLNQTNSIIWISNPSKAVSNPVAQLLDTGNLVVRDGNDDSPENFSWQSFDHIGDSFLPGMKFGKHFKTGLENYLTCWKSVDDPSPGDYTNRLDQNGYPQIYLRKGHEIQFRSGPWNGLRFSGMPNLKPNPIYTFEFVFNEEEVYYKYELVNSLVLSRMILNPDGVLQRFTWINRTQEWTLYLTAQMDNCDRYALCGAYGSCNINNSPACGCLKGFVPRDARDWELGDWSNGCVRRTELECGKEEGFMKIPRVKLPDTNSSWFNRNMDLTECEKVCLKNCSCTAYASLDIRGGGRGCLLWFSELIDIREYTENAQDIYVRMAASELEKRSSWETKKRLKAIAIPAFLMSLVFLGIWLILHARKKKKKKKKQLKIKGRNMQIQERDYTDETRDQDLELPLLDLATIISATNKFSDDNKLGEGGYGPVYKGKLKNGQEVAVKRLSKDSKQGLDEFKNEVVCIAKLQHRNLVKLLGCCIEVEEMMLIYEYMPNKSLDSFIFDQTRSALLDWPRRFHIIIGIARGLLYLHQDSRLRIIHRDLKASNILLDLELTPKISDFGMARSFGGNEIQANTKRVVGTYGYMSPEYAIDGLFSIKSDVFSFGVLVLEIVSGKRNRGFWHPDHKHNLLGHAWRLYKEGRSLDLMDESIRQTCIISEVMRSMHVGLLCVQQSPEDRPSMSTVVLMLGSEIALPQPNEPGFFTERKLFETDFSSTKLESCSANGITITLLTPR